MRRFSYFLASIGFAAMAAFSSPAAAIPLDPGGIKTDTELIAVAVPADMGAVKAASSENRLKAAPVRRISVKTSRIVCTLFPVPGMIRADNGRVLAVPWARCYRR